MFASAHLHTVCFAPLKQHDYNIFLATLQIWTEFRAVCYGLNTMLVLVTRCTDTSGCSAASHLVIFRQSAGRQYHLILIKASYSVRKRCHTCHKNKTFSLWGKSSWYVHALRSVMDPLNVYTMFKCTYTVYRKQNKESTDLVTTTLRDSRITGRSILGKIYI